MLVILIKFIALAAFAADDAKLIEFAQKKFPGAQIEIRNGQGRVTVDAENKFSYYVFTRDPKNSKVETLFIPLSTSRFQPGYFFTNDWWDTNREAIELARKEQRRSPEQPEEEVLAYLRHKKLSTNPPVYFVGPRGVSEMPLQDYLLLHLEQNVSKDSLTLYRGAERESEKQQWEDGLFAKAARYFTPSSPYAWRYARKNPSLLEQNAREGVLQFSFPWASFTEHVRSGDIVLGTEFPKSAHLGFVRNGYFTDALLGDFFYLGQPQLGVDVEIRLNSGGKWLAPSAYRGAIEVTRFGNEIVEQVKGSLARLRVSHPNHGAKIESFAPVVKGQSPRNGFYFPQALLDCVRLSQEMGGVE